ncbi:Stp1/IreP family PP2C-type Ser/Thr phosphatase [Agaribacterium sp. ZY112]|uniref:Stp1/IreP family PP2C-type Ser/Thr phosphatase n=1 Tax=Agaribacterium sp. ZY112 TaxID=3233574 RepID=UPI0035268A9A
MNEMGSIRLAVNGRTDIGQVRDENEDSIRWFAHPTLPFSYTVIADGMGGYTGGALASKIAVDTLGQQLETLMNPTFLSCTPDQQELMIKALLLDTVKQANQAILNAKLANPQFAHMGTTLVLALVWQDQVTIAHLGDSRAYLWDSQGLVQLTKDHSVVQDMIDSGALTEDQARTSDVRNHITRALGVMPDVEPSINNYQLTGNALLMLCSDGLTEYLDNSELEFVLATHRPALECCFRFIDDANQQGGKDNISVGIIEYTVGAQASVNHFPPPVSSSEPSDDITVRKERNP